MYTTANKRGVMIRVLIADDHPIVRQGLKQILADTNDIDVVGEAGSGRETLGMLSKIRCNVIILDLSMPDSNGLDLMKQIKIEKPALPILILSVHPEEQYAVRTLRAGASGYLTKGSAPDELVSAVRKISAGGRYITGSLAEKLAAELQTPLDAKVPHEMLSDREYEVFHLIARGSTPAEIAKKLSLSPKTVSTYRMRIIEKTGLKTNAEIMRYAFDNNLAG